MGSLNNREGFLDPQRWGLSKEAISDLADRLRRIWARFWDCFSTRTKDASEYALVYLRGLLNVEDKRNYTNIPACAGRARRVIDPKDVRQNLQHFIPAYASHTDR